LSSGLGRLPVVAGRAVAFLLAVAAAACDPNLVEPTPDRPVAALEVTSSTGYAPASVHFKDRSRNEPATWLWRFGDGATSDEPDPVHRYTAPGKYRVDLVVTNEAGSDSASLVVSIAPPPTDPPDARFSAVPATGSAPVRVDFTDESTGFPRSWRWSFGDGTGSTRQNPRHVYTKPGRYEVRLSVTNIIGSDRLVRRDFVTVTRTDPVLVGAGDIAECGVNGDEQTAALIDRVRGHVFTVGDLAYPNGSDRDFAECYGPSWGRHKARTTLPVAGNHEYYSTDAEPFFDYFGARSNPGLGYYSRDIGAWHVVVLNSNCDFVGCDRDSAQLAWLADDLARSDAHCTLALFHHPRFSSGRYRDDDDVSAFWELLYYEGAEMVLNGHDHNYERFGPQRPDGRSDPAHGMTQIVVGTGGGELRDTGKAASNSMVRTGTTHGVLKLVLRDRSADWTFLPVKSGGFTDSGSLACHGPPPSVKSPAADFTVEQRTGAAPLTAVFTDTSSGPPSSWRWSFGDGTTSRAANPVHTYRTPGTYTVRLTVENVAGTDRIERARLITVKPPREPGRDYLTAVLRSNPVGYWRLASGDGPGSPPNLAEAAGRPPGTASGGVSATPDGATADKNGALLLDGRTGWVRIPDRTNLRTDGDFTVEAWARPSGLGTGGAVVQKGEAGDYDEWQYRLALTSAGQWRATVFIGSTAVAATAPGRVEPGRWTHLALVRNGGALLLYVDGRLVDSARKAGAVNDTFGSLAIGRAGENDLDYFGGGVDEVAVYGRALSSAEILEHVRAARRR
jgi:alkaline phosphatase